jgi:hypothetical protein
LIATINDKNYIRIKLIASADSKEPLPQKRDLHFNNMAEVVTGYRAVTGHFVRCICKPVRFVAAWINVEVPTLLPK